MDIFKVPTCCSCRIDGYKEVFPPLNHYTPSNTYHQDDYRPVATTNIRHPYSTIHGDLEDEEEDDENEEDEEDDSVGYQYSNGFKRSSKPYLHL